MVEYCHLEQTILVILYLRLHLERLLELLYGVAELVVGNYVVGEVHPYLYLLVVGVFLHCRLKCFRVEGMSDVGYENSGYLALVVSWIEYGDIVEYGGLVDGPT